MPGCKQPDYRMPLPKRVSHFKEETYIRILNIPCQKPSVGRLLNLVVWPEIEDYRLFSTKEGRSYEGFYLSGRVLNVTVGLNIKITYTEKANAQLVQVCDFHTLKGMDIVLPAEGEYDRISHLAESRFLDAEPYIEYSEVVQTGPKTLRLCGLLLVNVDLPRSVL